MFFEWEIIILSLYFLWFAVLTFWFFKFYTYFRSLAKSSKRLTLPEVLEEIFKKNDKLERDIQRLSDDYYKLSKESEYHIQKIGLLRFNPFKDTGGDQSFILSILDLHNTGVVISGLHTRSGTRWYAKKVVKGKGVDHTLSDDEQKAISSAKVISEK